MPYSGGPPTLQDAAPFRRSMRGTRLIGVAIVLFGLGVVAAGLYSGLFGPKPHEDGRLAIAVVESVGGGRQPPTVSVPAPDGGRAIVELRDPARSYELGGPVTVRVDTGDPAVVYDANGGRSNEWLALVGAGLVLMLFGRYVGRAARKHQRRVLAAIDRGLSAYDVTARRRPVQGAQGRITPWAADVWQGGESVGSLLLGPNAKALPTGDPVPARVWVSEDEDSIAILDTGSALVWQRDPVRNMLGWLAAEKIRLNRRISP